MERLDRGLVVVPAVSGGGNHVAWRLLGTDPKDIGFTLWRDGTRIARIGAKAATSFHDTHGRPASRYSVSLAGDKPTGDGVSSLVAGYLAIPLDVPADRTTPDGERYSYSANDVGVGDLDGDGRYELIVKWYPSIAKDNAFGGYTGETLLDAYTLGGRKLWRIDLGRNIRSGAHYTQFMVFDLDGDGRAEVAMKTADGTVDGVGKVIGDAKVDWREHDGEAPQADRTGATMTPDGRRVARLKGRILSGPEYLTVFDGRTGRARATADYSPSRAEGDVPSGEEMTRLWGDGYGNRSERYQGGFEFVHAA